MREVELQEMRHHADGLVRRAASGERVTITVAGRPAAILGPAVSHAWRTWDDVADVFTRPTDPEWAADRDHVQDAPKDP